MGLTEYVPRSQLKFIGLCFWRWLNLLCKEVDWIWASCLKKTHTDVARVVCVPISDKFVEISGSVCLEVIINVDTAHYVLA